MEAKRCARVCRRKWQVLVLAIVGLTLVGAAKAATVDNGPAPAPLGDSLSGNYLAARHAEKIGDMAAAADFLSEVLGREPDNPAIQRQAFMTMIADGRFDEALSLAERITNGGQILSLAVLARAIGAAKNNNWDRAETLLATPLKGNLGTVVAPVLNAWVLQGKGDNAGALAALKALEDKEGFGFFLNMHEAFLHDLGGDAEKAETAYVKARGGTEQPSFLMVRGYVSFLARAGRLEEARAILGGLSEQHRRTMLIVLAEHSLEEGRAAKPVVGSAAEGMAEALFEFATAFRSENAFNLALFFARLGQYLRADLDVAHVLIAELFDDHDYVEEAVKSYRRVSEQSPIAWSVTVRIAELLGKMDKTEEAAIALEAAAEQKPDRPEPLVQLGHLMRGDEKFAEAAAAYDRAMDRLPELKPEHWSLLYARGIARERLGEWDLAEADFLKALEFSPDQPFVLNYLGYSWTEQGKNLDRARDMIKRAVELRPQDGYIVDSLGWVMYRFGNYQEAVRHLERAAELRPEDPVINDHLGDAYWRVGRYREARFQWRRALSFKPEAGEVSIIQLKIKNGLQADKKTERDS